MHSQQLGHAKSVSQAQDFRPKTGCVMDMHCAYADGGEQIHEGTKVFWCPKYQPIGPSIGSKGHADGAKVFVRG